MNAMPRPSNAAVLLTFAAGAATGALLLALTSPGGGPLRCEAEDLGRGIRKKAGDVSDRVKGAWEGVKERVEDAER